MSDEFVERARRMAEAQSIWRNADQLNATSFERQAAQQIVTELDQMIRDLHDRRQELTRQIRRSDDAAMERTAELLEWHRKREQS